MIQKRPIFTVAHMNPKLWDLLTMREQNNQETNVHNCHASYVHKMNIL